PAAGQECSSPNPVCNQTIEVGNPGFQAYGNVCDFGVTPGNCLQSGERGSAWYEIDINDTGSLIFDIVPNDYDGVVSNETDYDFAIWKIAGTGAVTCAQIAAGTAAPVKCNYSYLGVTGLGTGGDAPSGYSASYDAAYEAPITSLTAGSAYLLVVSNYSNSTSG